METSEIIHIIAEAIVLLGAVIPMVVSISKVGNGVKCQLRTNILKVYYKHQEDKTLRQYERENVDFLYAAYKELKGNSFIDDVYAEIRTWRVDL